ncbi:MAG: DUF4340 domain-containing protein, partial [Bdellovibrionales bacterium]|nr:DUF4340 domain-containing protein [Bdellovibrionales bacterium]
MSKELVKEKKQFPTTLVFMVVVAAFATWTYFSQYKGRIASDKAKEEASAVLAVSNSAVTGIEISVAAGENRPERKTRLEKQDGTWRVLEPFTDLGDGPSIETFLTTVAAEKSKDTVVEAKDGDAEIAWATYGLDKPSLVAILKSQKDTEAESQRKIEIGSVKAYDGSLYVRFDGASRVVLANSTLEAALMKDARDLRDKRFFPGEHPEFETVEILASGGPAVRLEKKEGLWVETGAAASAWPLDQGAVTSFVQSVSNLRGNDIWAEDKNDAIVMKGRKLDRPGLTVRLGAVGGARYEMKLAALGKDESVTAGIGSARPVVFSVYKAQIESLTKKIEDFRDLKHPFRFNVADVEAIELERSKDDAGLPVLKKKDGQWVIDPMDQRFTVTGDDSDPEVDSIEVDRLLRELSELSAKQVLQASVRSSDPAMGLTVRSGKKGFLRVGLFGTGGKALAEFTFAPTETAVRAASSKVPGRVLEVEKMVFDAFPLKVIKEK